MCPKRIIKCAVIFLVILSFFSLMCGISMAEKKTVLRFGYSANEQNPVHKGHEKFAQIVKERTNGRMIVELYGSGTLGMDRVLIEGCQIGSIDIGSASDGNLTDYTHAVDFLGLPYLFGNIEDAERFWSSDLRDEVTQDIEKDIKSKRNN